MLNALSCVHPLCSSVYSCLFLFSNWTVSFNVEFLKNVLLRYHSHTIQFTNLKCMMVLVYSQSCATIITINFRTFSLAPQTNPVPISSHFPSLPPPSFWKPLTYFLSLWICLFWTFHIHGIIQYVALWVWLLSFSIMLNVHPCSSMSVLQQGSALHSSLWLNNILLDGYTTFCLSIHHWWIFGLFPLFGYYK